MGNDEVHNSCHQIVKFGHLLMVLFYNEISSHSVSVYACM